MKKGMHWLGKKRPEHSKAMTGRKRPDISLRMSKLYGEKSPNWKKIEYINHKTLIWRVKAKYGLRPKCCDECQVPGAVRNHRYSISYCNVDGTYSSTDISQWKRLCSKCAYLHYKSRGANVFGQSW